MMSIMNNFFPHFFQSSCILANKNEWQFFLWKLKRLFKKRKKSVRIWFVKKRSTRSICYRIANIEDRPWFAFGSCKPNTTSSPISKFFSKLWSREKDQNNFVYLNTHEKWCQKSGCIFWKNVKFQDHRLIWKWRC